MKYRYTDTGTIVVSGAEYLHAALDLAGIIDPSGYADAANSVLYIHENNWKEAARSGVSLIPFGDLTKATRVKKDLEILKVSFERHHIIPKALYKRYDRLEEIWPKNANANIMELPTEFHWNHPEYTIWIEKELSKNPTDIGKVVKDAQEELTKGVQEYNLTGKRINRYFKEINNKQ